MARSSRSRRRDTSIPAPSIHSPRSNRSRTPKAPGCMSMARLDYGRGRRAIWRRWPTALQLAEFVGHGRAQMAADAVRQRLRHRARPRRASPRHGHRRQLSAGRRRAPSGGLHAGALAPCARVCGMGDHPRAWPRRHRDMVSGHCALARRMARRAGAGAGRRNPERGGAQPGRGAAGRRSAIRPRPTR